MKSLAQDFAVTARGPSLSLGQRRQSIALDNPSVFIYTIMFSTLGLTLNDIPVYKLGDMMCDDGIA